MLKCFSVLCFIPVFIFLLCVPASAAVSDPLYSFNVPRTFDSNNSENTGVVLFDHDKSFTVCIKFSPFVVSESTPFRCALLSITHQGGYFQVVSANSALYKIGYGANVDYSVVLSHTVNSSILKVYYLSPQDSVVATYDIPFTFSVYAHSASARIGEFSGTIYNFYIYGYSFDQSAAEEYLTGQVVTPPAFSNEFSFLFVLLIVLCLLFAIFVFVR